MGCDMNTTGEDGYEPIVERLSSGLNDGEEPGMISRSQRISPTGLCNRYARSDRTSIRVWCSHVWLAGTCARKSSQDTRATADCAGTRKRKKKEKIRSQGECVS
jgi:hypothetical protein